MSGLRLFVFLFCQVMTSDGGSIAASHVISCLPSSGVSGGVVPLLGSVCVCVRCEVIVRHAEFDSGLILLWTIEHASKPFLIPCNVSPVNYISQASSDIQYVCVSTCEWDL